MRSVCLLAIASLCLVAAGAAKRPAPRKRRPRRPDKMLKIGQMAPDFELYTLKHAIAMKNQPTTRPAPKATSRPAGRPLAGPVARGKVRLSSFRGKRPVYLIFASYT